ncbi:GGDEF domain-containing protein [Sphingobium sp. AEW4]|nr:GGDEF domain-containing protein [Sphingobium sp. AEW4]
MRGMHRILAGISFSVSTTMAAMFVASRFPGMEIPFPYWIFGFCTPLCISTPVCIIMNRQAEQKRRLNDKLRAALVELQQLAEVDQMTGLLNRATFLRRLQEEQDRQPGTCLLIDVDHFKAINDGYGHAMGDRVLKAIADSLRATIRSDDLCGRLGGEEFAIYLRNMPSTQATAMAERVRQAIEMLDIAAADGTHIRPTISVGAAHADGSASAGPGASASADQLLQRADMAMYAAKANGRNQVRLAA